MGYLILVISALFDSSKGLLSRKLGNDSDRLPDAVFLNLMRCIVCAVLGLLVCLLSGQGFPLPQGKALWITLLSGALTSVFMVSWLLAVKVGAFLTLTVICNVANLLPVLLSALFYGESIRPQHLAGLALLIGAILMMGRYTRTLQCKPDRKGWLMMVFAALSYGLYCFTFKMFAHSMPQGNNDAFQFYTYLFAALVLLLLLPVTQRITKQRCDAGALLGKTWLVVLLMSVFLFLCSFTKAMAAQSLPAGVLYSMSSSVVMLLNILGTKLFFHEPVTRDSLLGCGLTVVALIVINL